MTTLRAIALILDAVLLVIAFWIFSREGVRELYGVLALGTLFATPLVNGWVIIAQARGESN
jgi:hypothetical protein